MDPRVKKMWVKNLRSGKIKQGQHKLAKIEDGEWKFCCLGVLTEMYQTAMRRDGEPVLSEHMNGNRVVYDRCHEGMPPVAVSDWANLGYSTMEPLASKNDSGWSFKIIADWIEKEL